MLQNLLNLDEELVIAKRDIMKKWVLFGIVFITTLSCNRQLPETDLKSENIFSAVKSIVLLHEEYNSSKRKVEMVPWTIDYYNQEGFKIKYEFYKGGVLRYTRYYTYNNKNQLIIERSENPTNSNIWEYETRYSYNSRGLLVKEVKRNLKEPLDVTTYTYKYDRRRNLVEEKESEIDDTFVEGHQYVYGNRGLKIEEKVYYDDELVKFYRYTYNIEGQIIETNYKDYQSTSSDYTIIRYDQKGNLLSYTSYNGRDIKSQQIHEYDNYNNQILEKLDGQNSVRITNEYSYSYDQNMNWIKMKCFTDGKLNFT